jgi:pyruvate,water dikinase
MSGGIVPLVRAGDEARFGGKAVQLGAGLRQQLPVPDGIAVAWEVVDAIAEHDAAARAACLDAVAALAPSRLAVRSSAVGEDSAGASFAGQHLTTLAVHSADAVIEAIVATWQSGRAPGALAYREKRGIAAAPRVAVVIQKMVDAECAGVLFTKDPVTGADHRVIEAAWGLGESVVSGLVDPDRYRVRRGGEVIEATAGDKHVAVQPSADGGTVEQPLDDERRTAHCLDTARLRALDALASACERTFGGTSAHDIEWAFDGETVYLLQRRPVTTRPSQGLGIGD